jgi:hypothetical protein
MIYEFRTYTTAPGGALAPVRSAAGDAAGV